LANFKRFVLADQEQVKFYKSLVLQISH